MKRFLITLSLFIIGLAAFAETGYKGLKWGHSIDQKKEGLLNYVETCFIDEEDISSYLYQTEKNIYFKAERYNEENNYIYYYAPENLLKFIFYVIDNEKFVNIKNKYNLVSQNVYIPAIDKSKHILKNNVDSEFHSHFLDLINISESLYYFHENKGEKIEIYSMNYNDDTQAYFIPFEEGWVVVFMQNLKPDF